MHYLAAAANYDHDWALKIMIGIGYNYYADIFDSLDVVLGPANHLRSCGSTRVFICV